MLQAYLSSCKSADHFAPIRRSKFDLAQDSITSVTGKGQVLAYLGRALLDERRRKESTWDARERPRQS
jgi:hypothetical protein